MCYGRRKSVVSEVVNFMWWNRKQGTKFLNYVYKQVP
jgi:hypothetical protein